jgi:hypothetical protein
VKVLARVGALSHTEEEGIRLLLSLTLFASFATAQRWTEQRADVKQPWLVGGDYVPATAIDGREPAGGFKSRTNTQ